MAYITTLELRDRLPLEGQGVSDAEIDDAISAANAYVSALTGDTAGTGAVPRSAAAKLAQADVLDIIYPRDTRDTTAMQVILRQNAEEVLKRYLSVDDDPVTGAPVAYLSEVPW